jgi:hypothetical protein
MLLTRAHPTCGFLSPPLGPSQTLPPDQRRTEANGAHGAVDDRPVKLTINRQTNSELFESDGARRSTRLLVELS